MSQENFTPSLSLTPEDSTPSLTLDVPTLELTPTAPEAKEVEPPLAGADCLSPEELKMVDDFATQIDLTNSALVLQYGSASQQNVAGFSEKALASTRTKDFGEVGEQLTALTREVTRLGAEDQEEKGLKGFFKKKGDALENMRTNFATAEKNVEKITQSLEAHQVALMKDIAMLDQMYELNLKYYKELTMYILAGKKHLAETRATKLEELRTKAQASGLPQDAQAYNDYDGQCNQFEKKLHDLDLTRMISIQMGPQTRLLQNNNIQLVEKLQSSIVNTIPLWKNQMVLALGMHNATQALNAQKAVTDVTNEMLKKNADMLKMNTIETAKAAERSVVDIETLQHTNQQLISTLDEVLVIQREGADKRREAEAELGRIEVELREKLLEVRDRKHTVE